MRYSTCLLLLPILLLGCAAGTAKNEAPGPAAQATGLTAEQARIADTPILADRNNLDKLQQRLRALSEAGVAQNNYPLAKAQCWLDTAKTQYQENDRTGYIEESATESSKIIQALETNKAAKVGYDTPLVARSARVRDDLWAQLGQFKNNDTTLVCNARTVACAEVRLVRAGHAQEQTGWRAATPHVQMAEDGIRRATAEAANCAVPMVAATAAVASAVPVAASPSPSAAVSKESFVILSDALFKFDKSARSDMLPGGATRLSEIAQRLKSYKSIAVLTIVGHTDRLGSAAYNEPLSLRRANTVNEALEQLGVKASKTETIGKGEREPVTTTCSNKIPRAQLIACLQPDRRVTIEVTGMVR